MLFCEGWFCIFMKGEHLLSLTEQDCGSGGLSGGDWTCPEWAGTVGTVTVPFPLGVSHCSDPTLLLCTLPYDAC